MWSVGPLTLQYRSFEGTEPRDVAGAPSPALVRRTPQPATARRRGTELWGAISAAWLAFVASQLLPPNEDR